MTMILKKVFVASSSFLIVTTLILLSFEEASAFSIGSRSIFSRKTHRFQSTAANSQSQTPSSIISSTISSAQSSSSSSSSSFSLLNPASKFFQLEEMEDRESCTTEIFLGKDGSVTVTDTNGPPPVRSSGTWKLIPPSSPTAAAATTTTTFQQNHNDDSNGSNTGSFEMTITRTYGTGSDSSDVGEFCFDVVRTFVGDMSSVGGLVSVSGSMHMMDDFFGDTEVGFFSMIDTTDAKLGEEQN